MLPLVDFNRSWTDEELYSFFKLGDDEVNFIEATIREM